MRTAGLIAAALVSSLAASGLNVVVAEDLPPPKPRPKRRTVTTEERSAQAQHRAEIEEWNEQVEAKKAAKRARRASLSPGQQEDPLK